MLLAVTKAIDEKLAGLTADNERLTHENTALKKACHHLRSSNGWLRAVQ